ncbi:MAG: penicillin acylase family protein [Saprospiraceae bacterium]|nr:penicillin acylase family protein [Saprospiraceae bacterium]
MKVFILVGFLFVFSALNGQSIKINADNITIIRDKWGVPHIFTKTDAEAAYGLAWAHSEDNFKTIQETFLPAISMLGSYKGKEGVIFDYVVQLLRCRNVAKTQQKYLSKEVLQVIEGYVEGINAFAKAHPNEVLVKKTFPITVTDYLTAYNLVIHFFSDSGDILNKLFNNKIKPIDDLNGAKETDRGIGSNGFAISKNKTKDGKTYLNVNTHQPLDGPFSWYEAHMVSEEGWNMLGALFPGSPFPLIGTNEYLGWTHTYNYPDLIDVYQLEMHPTKKNKYKFDGEWLPLEESKAKLKVKIFLGIKIPVTRKIYWCKYGPVIKNKSGYFSFHSNALSNISSIDQWYQMNKASDFVSFKKAVSMVTIPRFNIVYADREDNIFYLSAGKIPIREGNYNWEKLLPGNTSKTKTKDYQPIEKLPQVLNPNHGYIFNTNNSPFNCTHPNDNLNAQAFDSTIGYREKENNRSVRFMELINNYDKLSYEDFLKIKYDTQYPDSLIAPFQLNDVFRIDPNSYPEIKDLIEIIQKWDRRGNIDNLSAAYWRVYYEKLTKRVKKEGLYNSSNIDEKLIVETLRETKEYFLKHFNSLKISLGEYQKHTRSDIEFPICGLEDMIAAMHTTSYKNGKARSISGESYIMLVRYKGRDIQIETVLPYGQSNHPTSIHYTDQMNIYAHQKRKLMTLDKEKIYQSAVKRYHPKEKKQHH